MCVCVRGVGTDSVQTTNPDATSPHEQPPKICKSSGTKSLLSLLESLGCEASASLPELNCRQRNLHISRCSLSIMRVREDDGESSYELALELARLAFINFLFETEQTMASAGASAASASSDSAEPFLTRTNKKFESVRFNDEGAISTKDFLRSLTEIPDIFVLIMGKGKVADTLSNDVRVCTPPIIVFSVSFCDTTCLFFLVTLLVFSSY